MGRLYKYAQMLCPFPTISREGTLANGSRLGQCQMCRDCKTKDCRNYASNPIRDGVDHCECRSGLSVFLFEFDGERIVANGMLEPTLNQGCRRGMRRRLRNHTVRMEQAKEWRAVAVRVAGEIEKDIDIGVKESIASLHDIKTAVSLVYRNAEGLIQQNSGADFDEKVENAESELKSLLKSVSLLNTRMSMASIAANPESASFGQKRPVPIYKIFDKMCHLFEELAGQRRVRVKMSGHSLRRPMGFESIESLALVLVDNAVKYSLPNEEVVVRVDDVGPGSSTVAVEVESVGPLVPPEKQEAIFEKGYRCPNATQYVAGGSGLGLYIARLVAGAHGFKIEYRGVSTTGDHAVGKNIFSFRMS